MSNPFLSMGGSSKKKEDKPKPTPKPKITKTPKKTTPQLKKTTPKKPSVKKAVDNKKLKELQGTIENLDNKINSVNSNLIHEIAQLDSQIRKLEELAKGKIEIPIVGDSLVKKQNLIDEFEQLKMYFRKGKRPAQIKAIENFEKHLQDL